MDPFESLSDIREIKESVEDDLRELSGVNGVDIGYKEVGGRITDELAIRVLVREKKDVPSRERIPPEIEGVKTDVIERTFVRLQDTGRYDPIIGGISIGTCGGITGAGAGTLGGIVLDKTTKAPMVLTNKHVVVDPDGALRDIAQPAPIDGGRCIPNLVGTVVRFVENEDVDCAVASIDPSRNFACQIAQFGPSGTLQGKATVQIGSQVMKRGRRTGVTWGIVDTLDLSTDIYDPVAGEWHYMKRQIGIWRDGGINRDFMLQGDSGSLLLRRGGVVAGAPLALYAVGLLHAGGPATILGLINVTSEGAYAVASPIDAVLQALDIEICTTPKTKEKEGKDVKDKDTPIVKETDGGAFREKISVEAWLLNRPTPTRAVAPTQPLPGAPLAERLARLEAAVGEMGHFIDSELRPNLGTSAFASEPDLEPTEQAGEGPEDSENDVQGSEEQSER